MHFEYPSWTGDSSVPPYSQPGGPPPPRPRTRARARSFSSYESAFEGFTSEEEYVRPKPYPGPPPSGRSYQYFSMWDYVRMQGPIPGGSGLPPYPPSSYAFPNSRVPPGHPSYETMRAWEHEWDARRRAWFEWENAQRPYQNSKDWASYMEWTRREAETARHRARAGRSFPGGNPGHSAWGDHQPRSWGQGNPRPSGGSGDGWSGHHRPPSGSGEGWSGHSRPPDGSGDGWSGYPRPPGGTGDGWSEHSRPPGGSGDGWSGHSRPPGGSGDEWSKPQPFGWSTSEWRWHHRGSPPPGWSSGEWSRHHGGPPPHRPPPHQYSYSFPHSGPHPHGNGPHWSHARTASDSSTSTASDSSSDNNSETALKAAFGAYDAAWEVIIAEMSPLSREANPPLTFLTIPWPQHPPPRSAESINLEDIREFLGAGPSPLRARIHQAYLRFHPDKITMLLSRVRSPAERERVAAACNVVTRYLGELKREC